MKPILDMCCGSRMFYFDKSNPNVLFCDIREGIFTNLDRGNERITEAEIKDIDERYWPFAVKVGEVD